jgi:hypothetical protein
MAKISIELQRQEVTAFTFGKDRASQIKTLRERIANDTAELNRLLAEMENGQKIDILSMLKGMDIKASKPPHLSHLEVVGADNALAEIDTGVKARPSQAYAYTLLTKEDDGKYAFAIVRQKVKLLNFGGTRPNSRTFIYSLYEKVFIAEPNEKGVNSAFATTKKLAHTLSDEKIHVDEKVMN